MCGIVGLLSSDVTEPDLHQMNGLQFHRGPDDGGIYLGDGVGLAARRLSIIDVAGGHQPLCNEDGTVWISYNGEVFNSAVLRQELEHRGHVFRTHTDTETIVHAYEEWGDEAVGKLRGMFVFAIWDVRQKRLLLARDRFGMKPLYYGQENDRFAFASEISPLLTVLPRHANHQAHWHLFELGFIPSPLTAFGGIYKLPAAHLLVWQRGNVEIRPYWSPTYPISNLHSPLSEPETIHQFTTLLRQSVAAWRMSDVPVGSLLSGGIDSATLAALLTEINGQPIHTFTIGFEAASHDETALAALTARHIGSHHHTLHFSTADFDHLPHIIRHLEEPQCSATSIPLYLLYKACHEAGFKVILTGEGADELLGGYHWFDGDRRIRPFLALPRLLRQLLSRLPLPVSAAGRRVLAQGNRNPVERYWLWQQVLPPDEICALVQEIRREERGERSETVISNTQYPIPNFQSLSPLNQFLLLENRTRLVDFINFEVDRMSMANSVEARPPFLDHELWEFCARLPDSFKLRSGLNKYILRQGMQGVLPTAVLQRPKKGLATPHALWWRQDKLPAWAEEAIHPTALHETGYFHTPTVQKLRQEHQNGRFDRSRVLMGILTTQLWHQLLAVSC